MWRDIKKEEERKRTPLLQLVAGAWLPRRILQPFPAAAQGRCPQQDGAELITGSGPSIEILSSRSKKMEVFRPKAPASTETEELKTHTKKLAVMRIALDKVQTRLVLGARLRWTQRQRWAVRSHRLTRFSSRQWELASSREAARQCVRAASQEVN